MKPYYSHGGIQIFCGDCREVLPTLGKVDLVLTDPPYGMRLNTDFSGMKSRLFKGKTGGNYHESVIGDDVDFDPRPILCLTLNVKEQFWFGADYYCKRIPDIEKGSWLVWDKRLSESADKMWGSGFELIWSKKARKRDIIRCKWAGIFGIEKQDIKERLHPTQKPIALISRLIQMVPDAQIILDPFMGSGTTLVAAKELGRKAIGVEIEEKYAEIAVRRLSQEVLPL
jgi:site-specific DNA-methyltransferase (adenine-specific)/modification methylase